MSLAPDVLALVGSTGTGKTAVSLALAAQLDVEIVCGDSRQLFAGLDAGTGKPTAAERSAVPHHLFDALAVRDTPSAGSYARAAAPGIEGILSRGRVPLVVGGSGLYLKAVYRGLAPVPEIPIAVRDQVRRELAERGPEQLHRELVLVDPDSAARLAVRDRQRVARALEVTRATGRSLSSWQREPREPTFGGPERWRLIALCLARPALHRRLDRRTRAYFENGLLAETRAFLEDGVPRDAPGLASLGYAQAVSHCLEGIPLAQARGAAQRATRQYAKRQETWWRHEGPRVGLAWLDIEEEEPAEAIAQRVLALWRQPIAAGVAGAP